MKGWELKHKLEKWLSGTGWAGKPIKVLLNSGDIVEVKDVKLSHLNGGEVHIVAGPTEDEIDL